MNKNYKFNSVSLNIDDGVLENIFRAPNSKEVFNLSKYPIKTLSSHTLYMNSTVKEVILPETLETIIGDSITGCRSIEKINIPKSVKEITSGEYFLSSSELYQNDENWTNGCFSLDGWVISIDKNAISVIIPPNHKLANQASTFNSNLQRIEFSSGIKTIPESFLYYCNNVNTLILNNDLERIESYAFELPNLTEIKLPESIKYIGTYAIESNMQKVYITNLKKFCEIERGSSIFYGSEGFDIYLNNTILKNVIFPSDLDIIKPHTFFDSSIESITIPTSVKEIGGYSFNYCYNLKNINYQGTVAEWKSIIKPKSSWAYGVPATYVQCTDGQVQL